MAFKWDPNWNGIDPKTGTKNNYPNVTDTQIVAILAGAKKVGTRGDAGLIDALSEQSNQIEILKGVHQEAVNLRPHITVGYLGGTWHVNVIELGTGGYRASEVTQWKE